jgi:hypothetical protein
MQPIPEQLIQETSTPPSPGFIFGYQVKTPWFFTFFLYFLFYFWAKQQMFFLHWIVLTLKSLDFLIIKRKNKNA